MRELTFRAWDTQVKRMSKPFKLGDQFLEWEDGIDINMPLPFFISKKRGIIMQSTDLLDINGKEIFEGDIVKAGNLVGYIHYSNGSYFILNGQSEGEYIIRNSSNDESESLFYAWALMAGNINVRGNIYENPETL